MKNTTTTTTTTTTISTEQSAWAKPFAHQVMTPADVCGYNAVNSTEYESKDALLNAETDESVLAFYRDSWTAE